MDSSSSTIIYTFNTTESTTLNDTINTQSPQLHQNINSVGEIAMYSLIAVAILLSIVVVFFLMLLVHKLYNKPSIPKMFKKSVLGKNTPPMISTISNHVKLQNENCFA